MTTKKSAAVRYDAVENNRVNLGNRRSKASHTRSRRRRPMNRQEILNYEADNVIKKIIGDLPSEALDGCIVASEKGAEIQQALDDVGALAVLQKALYIARRDGGAAILKTPILQDGEEIDYSKPFDPSRGELADSMPVISCWDLQADVSSLDVDPASKNFLLPEFYTLSPRAGSSYMAAEMPRIHYTHLIRIVGDPVDSQLLATYRYWGSSAIEGFKERYDAYEMANLGGAEALFETAGKLYKLQDFNEMVSGAEGFCSLDEFKEMQVESFSTNRSLVVGPGDEVERFEPSFTGWSDVYDRQAQAFAAAAGEPVTKLFGQAPGGLSTDDAAARDTWDRRVKSYRKSHVVPALNEIVDMLLANPNGPTAGQEVSYTIEFRADAPMEPEEQAELISKVSSSLALLVEKGLMTRDEARDQLRQMKLLPLQDVSDGDDASGE